MTKARKLLHKRINWPADIDMGMLAKGIYTGFIGRLDAAGFPVSPTYDYYLDYRLRYSMDKNDRIAAMWYAVMRTAIETYGMKA